MLFKYKDIDFDINENEITEKEAKSYGDKISIASEQSKVDIFEVSFEDKTFGCVFIKKKGEYDEWDAETIAFVKILQNISEFTVMYADEDYGENLDVILIHNE